MENLLNDSIGCGRYQIVLFAILGIFSLIAIDSFAINFLAAPMDHTCVSSSSWQLNTSLTNISNNDWQVENRCYLTELPYSNSNSTSTGNKSKCTKWIYDYSVFNSTIVSEWDLVCEDAWLVDLVSAVYMVGRVIACLTGGVFSDWLGRKTSILFFHLIKILGGILSLYSPNYLVFLVSRLVIGYGSTASTISTFVMLSEMTGPKWRHIFGVGWSGLVGVGGMVLSLFSFLFRDFRTLQAIYTWPQISLLLLVFVLDESPRWLASKGRIVQCISVINKMLKFNKQPILTVDIDSLKIQTSLNVKRKARCCDIIVKSTIRKRSIILWMNWFTTALIYYALSLNTGRLPGNIFLNTFMIMCVEIPAVVLSVILLKRLGGRLTVVGGTVFAAISIILMIPFMYIPGGDYLVTIFAILGKLIISIGYMAMYVVTSEMYPTNLRNMALGISAAFGRLSSISSAFFVGYMSDIWRPLPCVVFGVMGFTSGSLILLLPKTQVINLPEYFSDSDMTSKKGANDENKMLDAMEINVTKSEAQ